MTFIVRHPAANQLHFIQHRGNTNDIIRLHHPTTSTTRMSTHPTTSHPPTSGNPGANGRTIQSPNLEPIHRVGLTIPRPPPNITATMTLPTSRPANLTAFSSDRPRHNPHRSSSIQSRVSTSAVPPGHVPINLQDGSKEEWARHVEHALNHPDRM